MSVNIFESHDNKPMMRFSYGDEQIEFVRETRRNPSNRLLIKVHPNLQVVVSAPDQESDEAVLHSVKKRARWIFQQLKQFKTLQQHALPRRYISGESHFYLGKQYVLKVIEAPTENQSVKLMRGQIEVKVRQKSEDRIKRLVSEWYKARAKEVFAKRLDVMLEQALWMNHRPPIRIQSMQTQWGSCSPNGRLTLNPNLVKAHRDCIDYVILHELCHIAEHNHSERFWRLLSQVMPNWEQVKSKLDDKAYQFID
jgi:hypothetical protein